jgi:hypothetical protein
MPEQDDPHAAPRGGEPPPAPGAHAGEPQPWWMKLIEPFRSEAAAFRMLLTVVAICAAIAVVVLIARAL